jgi:hypothetical protein
VREGLDGWEVYTLVRGYVPGFFPIDTTRDSGANWLSTHSSVDDWWRGEIEEIGDLLAQEASLNDNTVKRVFRDHHWEADTPVEGISVSDRRGRWKYDAYRNRVAVEVELSSRSQVFKDSFKFLIGQALSQIDLGIIMVRRELVSGKPWFGSVRRDWHAIYTTMPMLNVAFYGF